MAVLFSNNATTTLASSISSGATSMTVTSGGGALFPAAGSGNVFYATLVDASNNIEIVKVTARASDAMTIERAQEGTTARAYAASDKVDLRVTAAGLNNKLDKDTGGTIDGSLTVSTNLTVNGNTVLGNATGDTVTINSANISVPVGGATVSGGIVTFSGGIAVSGGTLVTTTNSVTMTNKTLTSPTINSMSFTSSIRDDVGNGYEVGYRSMPVRAVAGDYAFVTNDVGKFAIGQTSGSQVFYVTEQTTGGWVAGHIVTVYNNGNTITLAGQGAVVLRLEGTASTGNRNVAQFGRATCLYLGSDVWSISGAGVS